MKLETQLLKYMIVLTLKLWKQALNLLNFQIMIP